MGLENGSRAVGRLLDPVRLWAPEEQQRSVALGCRVVAPQQPL